MRRFPLCAAAVLAGVAAGCQDSTAPEPPEFELAVVHVAPGAGDYSVEVGEEVLSPTLAPMRALVRPVVGGERTIAFTGADSELTVDASIEDLGHTAVLMDGSSPELRVYVADTATADVPLTLVNAVPDTVLDVYLDRSGGGAGAVARLSYGGTASFGLPVGFYSVRLAAAGSDQAPVPVHTLSPPGAAGAAGTGRRGITIIGPGVEGGPLFEVIEIWFGPAGGGS